MRGTSVRLFSAILVCVACELPTAKAGEGEIAFTGRRALAIGYRPSAAQLADLDADTDLDLVVVNRGSFRDGSWIGCTAQVFLSEGEAGFEEWTAYWTPNAPSALAICDFDANGAPDLATANTGADSVSILMNDGSGSFSPGPEISVGVDPNDVHCPDLNGDQRPDIVSADNLSYGVSVILNLGDGSFGPAVSYPLGGLTPYVSVGKVDDDADTDIVAFADVGIFLLRNAGDGTFGDPEPLSLTGAFGPSELCDFDGDGDLDLVSASGVRLGNGDGSFDPNAILTDLSVWWARAHCYDFDVDQHFDVVTSEGVALADGLGGLAPSLPFDPPPDPGPIALGDIMDDAMPDLVRTFAGVDDGAIGFATPIAGRGSAGIEQQESYYGGPMVRDVAADPGGLGVVVANRSGPASGTVDILPSLGDGSLGPRSSYPAGVHVRGVSLGDLDDDGNIDVVAPNFDPGEISILLGDGAGGLMPRFSVPAGTNPEDAAIADFDGQAGVDIAVVNYLIPGNSEVSILLSDGEGGFASPLTHLLPCGQGTRIVTADFDVDGATDFAVACGWISLGLAIGWGQGDGNFSSIVMYPTQYGARAVDTCDLDQDGDTDLVTLSGDPPNLHIGQISSFLNDGAGGFVAGPVKMLPYWDFHIRCEDVSGDGKPDVALPYLWASVAGVFEGLGTGGFAAPTYYEVGEDTRSVAIADLNTDGRPDLIVANGGEINRVTVLMNASESTAERVPGLSTPVLLALAGLLLAMGHFFSRRNDRVRC